MPPTWTSLELHILAALKQALEDNRTDVEELLLQVLEALDRPVARRGREGLH